jgi:hypothetical protein
MRFPWWSLLALPGCFVAIPPPAGLGGVTAGSVYTASTPTLSFAGEPQLQAGSVSLSASPTSQLGYELRGEASPRHVATAPGLWLRTPLGPRERVWGAIRPGVIFGTGELGDYVPFDNPYLGGSVDLQLAYRFGRFPSNPGALALTVGGEVTQPLYGDTHPTMQIESTSTTVGGAQQVETHDLQLMMGAWMPLELRAELPVQDIAALTGTVGIESYLMEAPTPAFWRFALGVRVPLGRQE